MTRTTLKGIAAAALLALASTGATADDEAVVRAFYEKLLSEPGAADIAERAAAVVAEDWESTPTPLGGPGRAGLVETLGAFAGLIPDLDWEPQEIIAAGNRYTVRSVARGTPAGPFLGIEPSGKGFEIMTIDIHTVEDGLITRSWHVEDWATAMGQLGAE